MNLLHQNTKLKVDKPVFYPESDGKPMADNTKQFQWIVIIKKNLDIIFHKRKDVFVAGDLLWYPQEGSNKICTAPDVLVVFGVPKGHRGSYKQWEEPNNTPPQVVFEILSPSNTDKEMKKKRKFYEKYGVVEYYLYDPDDNILKGWQRIQGRLKKIEGIHHWKSPLLGIQFILKKDDLEIYDPNGKLFTSQEEDRERSLQEQIRADKEQQRANKEQIRANKEQIRADKEQLRANKEQIRADKIAQENAIFVKKLKALGINPSDLL